LDKAWRPPWRDHVDSGGHMALLILTEPHGAGSADLQRSHKLNPNDALTLMLLGHQMAAAEHPRTANAQRASGLRTADGATSAKILAHAQINNSSGCSPRRPLRCSRSGRSAGLARTPLQRALTVLRRRCQP
jgi:hypothetical protein